MYSMANFMEYDSTIAAAALATLTAVTFSTFAYHRYHKKTNQESNTNVSKSENCNEIVVELLSIDRMFCDISKQPVSNIRTLTWFAGDYLKAEPLLKARMQEILQKNPWLTGRIQKNQPKNALFYTKEVDNILIERHCSVCQGAISRFLSLDQIAEKLVDLPSFQLIHDQTVLWHVTILPCSEKPNEKFAVLVNMHHAIGDGHTYYQILNMLLNHELPLEQLKVERLHTTDEQQISVMGYDEQVLCLTLKYTLSLIIGVIKTLVKGGNKKCFVQSLYVIDSNKIETEKQEVTQKNQKDKDVTFVSTNDILTSWFCRHKNSKYTTMTINFRHRLEGHTNLHAGNYENVIFYTKLDSETPFLIRKSLDFERFSSYKRRVTKSMPSFIETVFGTFDLITNWSTFSEPSSIFGCVEEMHSPLIDTSVPFPLDLAILCIYRRVGKELGLFFFGSKEIRQELEANLPAFLQKDVCEE